MMHPERVQVSHIKRDCDDVCEIERTNDLFPRPFRARLVFRGYRGLRSQSLASPTAINLGTLGAVAKRVSPGKMSHLREQ